MCGCGGVRGVVTFGTKGGYFLKSMSPISVFRTSTSTSDYVWRSTVPSWMVSVATPLMLSLETFSLVW